MFSDPSTFLSLWTKSEKMKERQRIESNSSKRMLDVNSLLERKQTLIEYKSKFGVTGQDSGDLNSEKHGKLKYGMDEQDGEGCKGRCCWGAWLSMNGSFKQNTFNGDIQ